MRVRYLDSFPCYTMFCRSAKLVTTAVIVYTVVKSLARSSFYTLHNAIATNINNFAPPYFFARVYYTGSSRGSKGVLVVRY
jgi:hypothetical protein